jgi:hypothetical protein
VAAEAFASSFERSWQDPASTSWKLQGVPASYIYFVRSGSAGPIKIGRAQSPTLRVSRLQTANHEPLELLAVMPGGSQVEAALHRYLADDCRLGEWYNPSKRVLALVEEVRVGS